MTFPHYRWADLEKVEKVIHIINGTPIRIPKCCQTCEFIDRSILGWWTSGLISGKCGKHGMEVDAHLHRCPDWQIAAFTLQAAEKWPA